MKQEQIFEAIVDIEDNYIREAHTVQRMKPHFTWQKWASVAACACLVAVGGIVISNVLSSAGAQKCNTDVYGYTVSYAGFSDDQSIFGNALNSQLLQNEDIGHLPIFKMDTLEELEEFKATYESVFEMEKGYDNVRSFNGVLEQAQWDREIFYEEHSLLIVYVPTSSTSFRVNIESVDTTENSLTIYVEQKLYAEAVSDTMSGWFIAMKIEKKEVVNYTSLDAVFVENKS